MEAMRPKSVKELHASIAAAGRRRPLPPVANQLQTFVEQCRECEERCVSRLRERAKFEADHPAPNFHDSNVQLRRRVQSGSS
ncbi:unnamed protein product [Durusdinium trenchii]|uniref:Uncharacterized protein n=1 Tax=Durusdinium trenchii TaxID=1381693 RepID=A0ABP0JHL0_9DINO